MVSHFTILYTRKFSVPLQSFLIVLKDVSFHLTDVSIYLAEVPLQLTRFSLQLTEELLYKFGVNLKQNQKAKNKLSQRISFAKAFLLRSWTRDAILYGSPWLKYFHKAPRKTSKCFIHPSQSSCTTLLNLRHMLHITPMLLNEGIESL